MSLPTESDFNKFSNTKLTGTEWNQNVDKTVDVLTNGNYDLNINDITADQANITTATVTNLTATNANFNTIQNVSGNATAGSNSHIMVNATSSLFAFSALRLTLPQASDNLNKTYVITKSDTTDNPVKIDPNSSELINGASEFYLNAPYESITIICDGTQWFISNSTFDINKVGKVVWVGSDSVGDDVLELNGQYITVSTYPRLASIYGNVWGENYSSILRLPDLRSYFPKGKESGESVGDYIQDMTAVNGLATVTAGSHRHRVFSQNNITDSGPNSSSIIIVGNSSVIDTDYAGDHTHTLTGDSRTQPKVAIGKWVVYF